MANLIYGRGEIKGGQVYTYESKGGKGIYGLSAAINNYLSNTEKMETQRVNGKDCIVIQARAKGGKWKQMVGMDKAITVQFFKKSPNSVCMEIGEAKWIDKGAAMALSTILILSPLAVMSGIGMYQQGTLPGKIRKVADEHMGGTSQEREAKERSKEILVEKMGYALSKFIR